MTMTLHAALTIERRSRDGTFRLEGEFEASAGLSVVSGISGAGKSTLLATLAGTLTPHSGEIQLDDIFWYKTGATNLAPDQRPVALVFQGNALFPHMSAIDNVTFAVPRKTSRIQRCEIARAWLKRTHALHLANRHPRDLSGGEAQRVALARALARSPSVLLLDEPFAWTDRVLRRELADELAEIVKETGVIALIATHDEERDVFSRDRLIRVHEGRISGED